MAGATLTHDRVLNGRTSLPREPALEAWLDRFEQIYRESGGDPGRIPWAHRAPCPWLITWLNAAAPNLVRAGARAAVVGCGLGNDACALRERGYDVTAFDACPSAVEWARRRHPDDAACFVQADLTDLPGRMKGRFDLVVEVSTLQSLPPEWRPALAGGMADLLSHRGVLIAIARGREPSVPLETVEGPPWSLTNTELRSVLEEAGLRPVGPVDDFMDDSSPPVRRLRGAFVRA